MRSQSQLPAEVRAYLLEVEHRLASLPEDQRRQVVEDLTQHIVDATDEGAVPQEVLVRLGDPKEVAEQTFQQHQEQTGVDLRPRYLGAKRILQLIAASLAIAAALAVLFLPSYIEVTESSGGQESISSQTALEFVGPRILLVVAIPVALAALPLFARGRAWRPLSIASALMLTLFAVIGSLSVGWYFLPAMLVAIVAAFIPDRPRTGQAVQTDRPG